MNDFDSDLRQQRVDLQIDSVSNDTNVLIVSQNHESFTKKLANKNCTVDVVENKKHNFRHTAFYFRKTYDSERAGRQLFDRRSRSQACFSMFFFTRRRRRPGLVFAWIFDDFSQDFQKYL